MNNYTWIFKNKNFNDWYYEPDSKFHTKVFFKLSYPDMNKKEIQFYNDMIDNLKNAILYINHD